jgi:hypothetical protein
LSARQFGSAKRLYCLQDNLSRQKDFIVEGRMTKATLRVNAKEAKNQRFQNI